MTLYYREAVSHKLHFPHSMVPFGSLQQWNSQKSFYDAFIYLYNSMAMVLHCKNTFCQKISNRFSWRHTCFQSEYYPPSVYTINNLKKSALPENALIQPKAQRNIAWKQSFKYCKEEFELKCLIS